MNARNAVVRCVALGLLLLPAARMQASELGACVAVPLPQGSYHVSSPFGMRLHPLAGVWRMHWGLDLASSKGTPVSAVSDGVVVFAGRWGCYGNVVILRHHGDVLTLYAHLSHIAVRKGDSVRRHDAIGLVGATGCVTGTHLHFEVWIERERVNPSLLCAALTLL